MTWQGCHWWSKRGLSGIWDKWTRWSLRHRDQDSDPGRRMMMVSCCGGDFYCRLSSLGHGGGWHRPTLWHWAGARVVFVTPGPNHLPLMTLLWWPKKLHVPDGAARRCQSLHHPETLTDSVEHSSQWLGLHMHPEKEPELIALKPLRLQS